MKTAEQLAKMLADICTKSERGTKVTSIHLFGIRNADSLQNFTLKEMKEIAKAAGESPSYRTELHKMVRLSRHVVEKQ